MYGLKLTTVCLVVSVVPRLLVLKVIEELDLIEVAGAVSIVWITVGYIQH